MDSSASFLGVNKNLSKEILGCLLISCFIVFYKCRKFIFFMKRTATILWRFFFINGLSSPEISIHKKRMVMEELIHFSFNSSLRNLDK
ncbi:hypothetical protein IW15_01915 [Chryseobacterium soli]|uniref:Uncharacterized protein n=1 Tax=Chryseobacterium soli TaxID=445961 RepID=A0A086AC11_9FLAO|nr:hypothetical protein IW15_01915 [Chryseobacterium soli]